MRYALALLLIVAGVVAWSASAGAAGTGSRAAVRAQAPPAAPTIPARIDCGALVQDGFTGNTTVADFQEIPGAPTRVQSAVIVPATANQPEYCDVHGYVQSQIKFELKLPTSTWQGRYLQFGCGGFCGVITPTTFPACRTELGGDFAIASTNDGHDSANTDALWAGNDEQARIDFGYRGVHVVAVAAKAIQNAYYGRGPIRSYWSGCSDGGREGLMEAQRYPDDFDGIVAGAPANHMSTSSMFLAAVVQANTAAGGNPILTADKLAPLHDAVVAACDGNDGVRGDGLIGDPRDCRFDPASVRCRGADQPTCLTAAQVAVVRTIYAGVLDRQGRRLDPRMTPRGSELSWAGWWVPVPAPAGSPAGTTPTWIAKAFGESASRWLARPLGQGKPLARVELTVREFSEQVQSSRYYDAINPNVEAFRRRGGKLMLYQGLADALVPPSSTFEYYNALRDASGGQNRTDRFARLFVINGMNHCGGGPTPDSSAMILQMVRWVENGTAPESILATDRDGARTRPAFKYPLVAKYVGPDPAKDPTGPDKAENFVAAEPTVEHDDDIEWVGDYLLRQR